MKAIARAGWLDPYKDPGPPPWIEGGAFDKWTIPQIVRDILLNR